MPTLKRKEAAETAESKSDLLTPPTVVLKGMVELPLTYEIERPSELSLVSRISTMTRIV